MIVVDTAPLVASVLSVDVNHHACVELFTSAHLNNEPLIVPSFVVTEVCYFLEKKGGQRVLADFVRSLAGGDFVLADMDDQGLERAADLIETYADLPLGFVDASVIALAERLGAREIATLDRRHFSVVRPRHVGAFTLLP
jgi:predicted nucleic acid-binding protein